MNPAHVEAAKNIKNVVEKLRNPHDLIMSERASDILSFYKLREKFLYQGN